MFMNYQKPHKAPNKKIYTFHFFLEKLCLELVGDVRNTTQRGRRRSNGDVEGRLQDYGNHEVKELHKQREIIAAWSVLRRTGELGWQILMHLRGICQPSIALCTGAKNAKHFCALEQRDQTAGLHGTPKWDTGCKVSEQITSSKKHCLVCVILTKTCPPKKKKNNNKIQNNKKLKIKFPDNNNKLSCFHGYVNQTIFVSIDLLTILMYTC